MANVLGTLFSEIAGAIREKTGDTAPMKPATFPEKIKSISSNEEVIVGGVDPYYQKLAESLVTRNATYLSGDSSKMSIKGFITSTGDILGSVMKYAFAGFSNLVSIELSDVVFVYEHAFEDDSRLKIIDITVPNISEFNQIGFLSASLSGCNALETIIIRDGGCGIVSANVSLYNGANDTFYIYVPSAYYDTIISKINGDNIPSSRYRKLEEYPDIANWNEG